MFNFNYDPQRQGYDTGLWKTLSGTPAISGTKLRFSAASAIQYGDCIRGDYSFDVTLPAAPTAATLEGGGLATAVIATWNAVDDGEFTITINDDTIDVTGLDFSAADDMDAVAAIIQDGINAIVSGREQVTVEWDIDHFLITALSVVSVTSAVADGAGTDISGAGATAFMDAETGVGTATAGTDKTFGLTQLSTGSIAAFRIFGNKLRCYINDEDGSQDIFDLPWSSAWTTGEHTYRISWAGQNVAFFIDNVQIAILDNVSIPRSTMSLYVKNVNADNLDFGTFKAQGVESFL